MVGGGHVHKCAPEKAKYAWKCISVCAGHICQHAAGVGIYGRVCGASVSDGSSFEMLPFKVCFFHLGWFSCCGFSRKHQHLFWVCLPHARQFLMFYSFTHLSPKTENWSNFSFWMKKKIFHSTIWSKNSDNWTTWKNRLKMMRGGWLIHSGLNLQIFPINLWLQLGHLPSQHWGDGWFEWHERDRLFSSNGWNPEKTGRGNIKNIQNWHLLLMFHLAKNKKPWSSHRFEECFWNVTWQIQQE